MRYLLTVAVLLLFVTAGCKPVEGSGNIIEKEFSVSDIDEVGLSGSGVVYLSFGDEEKLVVKGDDNIVDILEVYVRDGELQLGKFKEDFISISPTKPIEFYLTVKDIDEISVSGSGELFGKPFQTKELEVSISGSGEVKLENIKVEDLEVSISGSGICEIGGVAERQKISISGSGEYKGKELISQRAECNISGSGEAYIYVEEFLEGSVSGSGDIYYWGAAKTEVSTSGSGDILYKGE